MKFWAAKERKKMEQNKVEEKEKDPTKHEGKRKRLKVKKVNLTFGCPFNVNWSLGCASLAKNMGREGSPSLINIV